MDFRAPMHASVRSRRWAFAKDQSMNNMHAYETQVAKLPCGRVIGWRAPEAGYAVFQPGSQSN